MQISGQFNVDGSGNVNFVEEDGMDYAAVTVQLPGGERVPFLFTIKELVAKVPLGQHLRQWIACLALVHLHSFTSPSVMTEAHV